MGQWALRDIFLKMRWIEGRGRCGAGHMAAFRIFIVSLFSCLTFGVQYKEGYQTTLASREIQHDTAGSVANHLRLHGLTRPIPDFW
jgi:hypothetical protein